MKTVLVIIAACSVGLLTACFLKQCNRPANDVQIKLPNIDSVSKKSEQRISKLETKIDSLYKEKSALRKEETIIHDEYRKTYEKVIISDPDELRHITLWLVQQHRHLDSI